MRDEQAEMKWCCPLHFYLSYFLIFKIGKGFMVTHSGPPEVGQLQKRSRYTHQNLNSGSLRMKGRNSSFCFVGNEGPSSGGGGGGKQQRQCLNKSHIHLHIGLTIDTQPKSGKVPWLSLFRALTCFSLFRNFRLVRRIPKIDSGIGVCRTFCRILYTDEYPNSRKEFGREFCKQI